MCARQCCHIALSLSFELHYLFYRMATKYIADVDVSGIYFTPMMVERGRKSVNTYMDSKNTSYANRMCFQLCEDEDSPLVAKFKVDSTEEGDPTRLNVVAFADPVRHKATVDKLSEIDRIVKETAVVKSKEWWKKELTKDQVEAKYNNPLVKWDEENGKYVVKFKIIVPPPVPEQGKKYSKPTPIYNISSGDAVVSTYSIIGKGCELTPSVSTMGVWFLGDASFGVSLKADCLLCKPLIVPSPLESMHTKRKYNVLEEEEKEKEEGGDEDAGSAM